MLCLREMTGMSQRQFADYFGVPLRTLQEWEQGRRKPPEYVLNMMYRIWELKGERTMKVHTYNTMELDKITVYEVEKIECIGFNVTEEEKDIIRNGGIPYLNFKTKEGSHMGVPVQLVIGITE